MACNSVILNSIDAKCDTSVGGIKEILIAQYDDIDWASVKYDDDAKKRIHSLKCIITTEGAEHVAKFETWTFRKNTGSYTSTLETDPAVGNSSITTEVALQFSRAEVQKRLDIQSAINASAVIIIRDMYDQYLFLGLDNDVTITSATMQSGTANTDLSGFNLTFTDVAQELPHFIKTKGDSAEDNDFVDIASLKVARTA